MKTPKREYYFYDSGINPENGDIIRDAVTPGLYDARWKRKNKIAQLKRTIARLKKEKEAAYHKGHKDGYDSGFARMWF